MKMHFGRKTLQKPKVNPNTVTHCFSVRAVVLTGFHVRRHRGTRSDVPAALPPLPLFLPLSVALRRCCSFGAASVSHPTWIIQPATVAGALRDVLFYPASARGLLSSPVNETASCLEGKLVERREGCSPSPSFCCLSLSQIKALSVGSTKREENPSLPPPPLSCLLCFVFLFFVRRW